MDRPRTPRRWPERRLRRFALPAPPANHAFAALWTAATISQFGTALGALTLTALISLRASPAQLGILAAANSAPVLLFALPAGVWVDRLPRRRLMVFADGGRCLLLLSVPAAALAGRLRIEQLYAVGFAAGALDLLFSLAYRAVLPALVPQAELVEANSRLQISDSIAQTVSPALGGGIVQAGGGPLAVLIDALSFLASGAILGRQRWPEGEPAAERAALLAETLAGFGAIVRRPALRAIFGMAATYSFFSGFLIALYGYWVVRGLGFSPFALGVLMGAGGLGSIAGAGLAGRVTRRLGWGPSVVGAYLVAAAALALIPLAREARLLGFAMLLGDQFFGDILWVIHNVGAMSVRQAVTPQPQLGRVNAAFLLASQGLRPLGALAAGPVAGAVGTQGALVVMVAGINLAGLWLYCSPLPRLRGLPLPRQAASPLPAGEGFSEDNR